MSAAGTASAETFDARVLASYGRNHVVGDDAGRRYIAVRRGKRGDVAIGDRVRCSPTGDGQAAIEERLPRRSLLHRADAWRSKELAANIDLVAVVCAARPAFNLYFLWRALIAAAVADLPSLVILNKTDLAGDDVDAARRELDHLRRLGHAGVEVAARADPAGTLATLQPQVGGRATLLVGQSGMGKSSLLNLLVPEADARTDEYSTRLNQGKQTTSASRWFDTPGGAVIDTPGFQSFGLAHVPLAQIAPHLPDFAPHLACRFLDCRHDEEPGCGVRAAVAAGSIDPRRYAFYRELAREAQSSSIRMESGVEGPAHALRSPVAGSPPGERAAGRRDPLRAAQYRAVGRDRRDPLGRVRAATVDRQPPRGGAGPRTHPGSIAGDGRTALAMRSLRRIPRAAVRRVLAVRDGARGLSFLSSARSETRCPCPVSCAFAFGLSAPVPRRGAPRSTRHRVKTSATARRAERDAGCLAQRREAARLPTTSGHGGQ